MKGRAGSGEIKGRAVRLVSAVLASRGEAELDCRALVDHMLASEDHALVLVGYTLAHCVQWWCHEGSTAVAVAVVIILRTTSTAEALPAFTRRLTSHLRTGAPELWIQMSGMFFFLACAENHFTRPIQDFMLPEGV